MSNRRKLVIGIALVVIIPIAGWLMLVALKVLPEPGKPMFPPFNLSDRLSKLHIEKSADGHYLVEFGEGANAKTYQAEEFLREVKKRQDGNQGESVIFSVLDITSWVSLCWVLFGFAGQAVFAGRMIVQWLAAEKARASVVPPVFWWMSLIGSTMLIIYFIWRVEIVGVLGQASGFFIYIRNLWFIYAPRNEAVTPAS